MFFPSYCATSTDSIVQGELEHRRVKRRFPRSGKKKDIRNISLAHQEAIERFIAKVDSARDSLLATEACSQPKRPPVRVRSPQITTTSLRLHGKATI
jgi:hypothetical protein